MLNLPSHDQLQDDPFGFRSASATRDKQESGRNPLPDTVGQDDPVTLPASRTPLAVDSPPQAQDATQDGGSFSVRNLFAPGDYEALSQIMHDLAVHDPAGKKERQRAQADSLAANPARRLGLTGGSALMVAAADTQNRGNGRGPLPLSVATKDIEQKQQAVTTAQSDPTKTIAKGRTLGPGLTLSQTESGEVAAFGPDGQVVDMKDKGVRSRFSLPATDAPKTANPGTVLSESRPSPLTRKQLDVYNADRANGYTGRRDYISPFLTPDQQRARQGEIYAQRQADREAIAQRLATENTVADLESQRTGVPTTSARNRSMLPTSERVMGERQYRAAAEQVATQRAYNMETAKLAATEKDSSMRDTTTRRGQDIEDEISRRTAQDNAENRKTQERIAQINTGSKTQRDYQREAMLKARSEAINAALSSDPKSVESPEFKKWLDETYPLMTQDELFEKERATGPDAKQYK